MTRALPEDATIYKTRTFAAGEIPAGLLRAHSLRAGTWARLTLLVGSLTYVDEPTGARIDLSPGESLIAAPTRLHHIEPSEDASAPPLEHSSGNSSRCQRRSRPTSVTRERQRLTPSS